MNDFGFETEDNFLFSGCCNGLICLTQFPCKCFILWNPATRKFHKYESDGYLKRFEGQLYPCIESGFGYVSSVNDYKYVRTLCTIWGEESCIIGLHVFSLREKRWRKINFDIELFSLHGRPVLINETLYWVGYSIQARHVIVSFDLEIEKFDIFPYPSSDGDLYMIGKMGECLCKFAFGKSVDILKPPSVMKSFRLPKCLGLNTFSEMIGYTKTGKFFVVGLLSESGDEAQTGPPSYKMSLVDPSTEPMQHKMLLGSTGQFNIARYVPSLVSPFPTLT